MIPKQQSPVIDLRNIDNIIAFFIDPETGQMVVSMNLTTHRPSDWEIGVLVALVEETLMKAKRENEGTQILNKIK